MIIETNDPAGINWFHHIYSLIYIYVTGNVTSPGIMHIPRLLCITPCHIGECD